MSNMIKAVLLGAAGIALGGLSIYLQLHGEGWAMLLALPTAILSGAAAARVVFREVLK